MDDIPWIYVAMIFIAFISWVRTRIKEAAVLKRERTAQRKALEKARNTATATPPPSPYRSPLYAPDPAPVSTSAATPRPAPTIATETPQTFRELFEMMQEQARADKKPPAPVPAQVTPAAPPPLPAPVAPARTAQEEIDAIFYGTDNVAKVTPAAKVVRAGSGIATNIKRMLSHRSSLREALVLKEILDKPVSIRE